MHHNNLEFIYYASIYIYFREDLEIVFSFYLYRFVKKIYLSLNGLIKMPACDVNRTRFSDSYTYPFNK